MYNRKILYKVNELKLFKNVAIYGAGKIGINFYKICLKGKINIKYFVDTYKKGKIGELKILNTKELINTNNLDCLVIASSVWDEIEENLLFNNITNFYIISNELVYKSTDLKQLGNFIFKNNVVPNYKETLKYFKNETKNIFSILVKMHLDINQSSVLSFFKNYKKTTNPYIDFIEYLGENITILDGGVADGKETLNFFKKFKNPKIYGFEPFIKNFNNSLFIDNKISKDSITILNFALWNKDENLNFNINLNSATTSNINKNGTLKVRGIKIDTFVKEYNIEKVSILKLDIEGVEYEALLGAKKTIQCHKPFLAISIYHKKEHLLQIPLLLKKLNSDYEFKLAFYTPTFIGTLLYAIPKYEHND